jgi:hypothetical protein
VEVVDVVLVLDGFAAVAVGVRVTVAGVHLGLLVPFTVVQVVQVIVVRHGLAAVVRQVFVIEALGVRGHSILLGVDVVRLSPSSRGGEIGKHRRWNDVQPRYPRHIRKKLPLTPLARATSSAVS